MEANSSIIFVTGGVRSGKSSFAERLAIEYARKASAELHYIATAVNTDAEMQARIARHQRIRKTQKVKWNSHEQSVDIGELARVFSKKDVILLDCLTVLVNNELFLKEQQHEMIEIKLKKDLVKLSRSCQVLILVSNEVTYEPSTDPFVQKYCRILNRLHYFLVQHATDAYLVENGIVQRKKGGEE
ncbi:bifunctional adenosylcobinamide kinase/adenosylcobinamide-phosphate guanylyltransferase [Niallia sp.]|uniref:bifunctional adenosylcobinamide kinase/adenosylcobinamide-phosphate guanylyltransferase n=1 Tax=Niallia sp. TaxID=2837523 RepID=UPI0028A254DD|nr:bifunctional adenosylcobinamide kinase/adenosylcobinamide-phosphate guanylyltransferase [Niallia sp.]